MATLPPNAIKSDQWRERTRLEHEERCKRLALFAARHRAFREAVMARDFALAEELLEEQRQASRGR